MPDENKPIDLSQAPVTSEPIPQNPYFNTTPVVPEAPVVTSTVNGPATQPQPIETNPVTPIRPRRKLKPKLIISVIAGVLILGGAATWLITGGIGGNNSALAQSFRENSAYEYKSSIDNIDPTHEFKFTFTDKVKGASDTADVNAIDKVVAVYSDASLTQKANASVDVSSSDHRITVAPSGHIDALDKVADESIRISNDKEWGLYDQYYLVQYVDLNTGETLKKPLVTPFSTAKKIQTPQVRFSTNDRGDPNFTWSPVEGATNYYIVKLGVKHDDDNTIIGQTDGTSWTYVSPDDPYQQNTPFHDRQYSDDDLISSDSSVKQAAQTEITALDGEPLANYGVVAAIDDHYSSIGTVDVVAMRSQLPYGIAANERRQLGYDSQEIATFDEIPEYMPMTMADGTTTRRAVIIDTAETKIVKGEVVVHFTIQGTMFGGNRYIKQYDNATYQGEVAKIATRNQESRQKTGNVLPSTLTDLPDLKKVSISKTRPSVPYKVNATNPLADYIAANMLDGQRYIDVSAFVTPDNPVSPRVAFFEATAQNPYILFQVTGSWMYLDDKNIIAVDYDESKDDMVAEDKKIDTEVKRVIGQIITPGMSDTQKASAINKYITSTATYNFDALNADLVASVLEPFRNSWSPSGVLFDKTAVCGGYAEAFKVLADAAGLDSVYVTGTADGQGHAWNKVKIDGHWRVIDTTWDDADPPDQYFLLTDAQVSQKRKNVEGSLWIPAALVSNYAAN